MGFVILIGSVLLLTFSLALLTRLLAWCCSHTRIWPFLERYTSHVWLILLIIIGLVAGRAVYVTFPHQWPSISLATGISAVIIIMLLAVNSGYRPPQTFYSASLFCLVFPIGEEILFRGIIQSLATSASFLDTWSAPFPIIGTLTFPVLVSATCFALNHLQYHEFKITSLSIRHISIAFLGGLFMGVLTAMSQSILPALLVHMAFNGTATVAAWRLASQQRLGTQSSEP